MICPKCGSVDCLPDETSTRSNEVWKCEACGEVFGRAETEPKEREETMSKDKCKIEGCEKVAWCRGLCTKHYAQERKERKQRGELKRGRKKAPATPPPAEPIAGEAMDLELGCELCAYKKVCKLFGTVPNEICKFFKPRPNEETPF